MAGAPGWFGPALLRAQRIDAYEASRARNPGWVNETPIGESVMRDFAYANPPFEHVNDYAAELLVPPDPPAKSPCCNAEMDNLAHDAELYCAECRCSVEETP